MGIVPGDDLASFLEVCQTNLAGHPLLCSLLNTTRDLLVVHLFFLPLAGKIQKGPIVLLLIIYSSFTIQGAVGVWKPMIYMGE